MKMDVTIFAKVEYRVVKVRNKITGSLAYMVYDGEEPVMICKKMSKEDFEYHRKNNECFEFEEIFKTRTGNKFIYWRDTEINADYITRV